MKSSALTAFATLVALSFGVSVLAGCGSKDDDKGSSMRVWITAIAHGDTTRIEYKASEEASSFKCMIEVGGQGGRWEDCTKDGFVLQIQPGANYVFKVKAIDKKGKEAVSQAYTFVGKSGTPAPATSKPTLYTKILNKYDVGDVYSKPELTLNFGIGGSAADIDQFSFECKRENETEFRLCQKGQLYDFGAMAAGNKYSLRVRAVNLTTRQPLIEDMVSFRFELPKLTVKGAEQLVSSTSGQHQLSATISGTEASSVKCSLDNRQSSDCTSGYTVDLSKLTEGNHIIKFQGVNSSGNVVGESSISFCASSCNGSRSVPDARNIVTNFSLGGLYNFAVPAWMHMTEHTAASSSSEIVSYVILSDLFYKDNYSCRGPSDKTVTGLDASGRAYDYCSLTASAADYANLSYFKRANNHIEVATDAHLFAERGHERLLINVFDPGFDFSYDRSRFEQLCGGRRGMINNTAKTPALTANGKQTSVSEIYVCVNEFNNSQLEAPQPWFIASVFITPQGQTLPSYECFKREASAAAAPQQSGTAAPQQGTAAPAAQPQPQPFDQSACDGFRSNQMIEVVYMTTKTFNQPADFAAHVQTFIQSNIK